MLRVRQRAPRLRGQLRLPPVRRAAARAALRAAARDSGLERQECPRRHEHDVAVAPGPVRLANAHLPRARARACALTRAPHAALCAPPRLVGPHLHLDQLHPPRAPRAPCAPRAPRGLDPQEARARAEEAGRGRDAGGGRRERVVPYLRARGIEQPQREGHGRRVRRSRVGAAPARAAPGPHVHGAHGAGRSEVDAPRRARRGAPARGPQRRARRRCVRRRGAAARRAPEEDLRPRRRRTRHARRAARGIAPGRAGPRLPAAVDGQLWPPARAGAGAFLLVAPAVAIVRRRRLSRRLCAPRALPRFLPTRHVHQQPLSRRPPPPPRRCREAARAAPTARRAGTQSAGPRPRSRALLRRDTPRRARPSRRA